jgi:acyl carrier protein
MLKTLNNVNVWLIKWFVSNSNTSEEEIKKNLMNNYFENGWIDSFKFIKFIADIEDFFKVTFSNDEFQNRNFATIYGLTKIIKSKIKKRDE